MKRRRGTFARSLLFLTILAVLTSTVLADSKHVAFSDPVTVGGTVLKPGTYKVVWIGSGPDVQVSFMKGYTSVATASARLVLEKSPYPHYRWTLMKTLPDNSRALMRLSFKNKSLLFDLSG